MGQVKNLHHCIEDVQDAAVELVLKSECAGATKAIHLLRAAGDMLDLTDMALWDENMRPSLGRSLNGEIGNVAWEQASLGYDNGGIAWKSVQELALPAFLASRTAARPAVLSLFAGLEGAGFGSEAELTAAFDERFKAAEQRLVQLLPAERASQLSGIIAAGGAHAEQQWRQMSGGAPDDPTVPPGGTGALEDAFLQDAIGSYADAGGEPGVQRSAHLAGPVQRAICAVCDEVRLERVIDGLRRTARDSDIRRINELRASKDQERGWLWAIQRGSEATLEPADFALAVRTMLGADTLVHPMLCAGCGSRLLDVQAKHALCCMGAATTVGHNRIRDAVAMGLAVADPGTIVEPLGLVPSHPRMRPADILSRAGLEQGLLALDIGVASPEAGGAGDDCVAAMEGRKKAFYGEAVLAALHAEGITYTPLIISCYGRRSWVLSELLRADALRAARTRDGVSGKHVLRRWERAIACEVWRRAARMVRRCLPRLGDAFGNAAAESGLGL